MVTQADSSNPQDVSQQLHELKQQYEQTTREFQKRIADLEEFGEIASGEPHADPAQ